MHYLRHFYNIIEVKLALSVTKKTKIRWEYVLLLVYIL
jgi:hypothetical protein